MIQFLKKWYFRNLSNPPCAVLLLQFITIFLLVYFGSSVIGPLIAALVLAFMLETPVSILIKHGSKRINAVIITMGSVLGALFVACLFVIPPALSQMSMMTQKIGIAINDQNKAMIDANNTETTNIISTTTNENKDENSDKTNIESKSVNSVDTSQSSNDAKEQVTSSPNGDDSTKENPVGENPVEENAVEEITAEQDSLIISDKDKRENDITMNWILSKFQKIKSKLPESYQNIITVDQIKDAVHYLEVQTKGFLSHIVKNQLAPLFMDTISFLVYLVIVPIFAFYMLKDKDRLLKLAGHYLSPYEEVSKFWQEIRRLISEYLNGNLIHIIIVTSINAIALWLLGLNYALLLGIGVGLSVLIPYVGMIVVTIPIAVIGFMQFGLSSDLMWLFGIYVAIQLIDAYVITPMLFSEKLDMDAFSILVAIFVFGGIWGFWGIVLAIPLATFVKTVFNFWPSIPNEDQTVK